MLACRDFRKIRALLCWNTGCKDWINTGHNNYRSGTSLATALPPLHIIYLKSAPRPGLARTVKMFMNTASWSLQSMQCS